MSGILCVINSMRFIKTDSGHRLLPINEFDTCLLDGVSKKEILNKYPTRKHGAYYLDKFINYLRDEHLISIQDYLKKYLSDYPKYINSDEDAGFVISGKGICFSNFKKGVGVTREDSPKFKAFCERISRERLGKNNPMFGKRPWNKDNLEFGEQMRLLRTGTKMSEEAKRKCSESAKKRKIHGHTGKKHSAETIEKLRINTASRYSDGTFKRETSIHKKVKSFLNSVDLTARFEEEFHLKYYSLDFSFPDQKIAIECQGTFFHVDPRFYPRGPENKIQRRNFGRDKAKKKYLDKHGWILIELWETEINNGEFEQILLCELQKLNLLSHLG